LGVHIEALRRGGASLGALEQDVNHDHRRWPSFATKE